MTDHDPIAALAAHYAELGKREAPPTLRADKPVVRLSFELLKLGSACAAGVGIVFALTNPSFPMPTSIPTQMSRSAQIEGIRREIVRCGLNPDEILGTTRKHTERTGGRAWQA